jgi:hypothetical protein
LTAPALSGFFNSAGVTALGGGACGSAVPCAVFTPSATVTNGATGQVTTNGAFATGGQNGWINGAGDPGLDVSKPVGSNTVSTGTYYEYAVFAPSTAHVPAPDMLGLTAIGLAAIVLVRSWRRRLNKMDV